jgi:glycosyltransferase involved in cell wall biosynthesis
MRASRARLRRRLAFVPAASNLGFGGMETHSQVVGSAFGDRDDWQLTVVRDLDELYAHGLSEPFGAVWFDSTHLLLGLEGVARKFPSAMIIVRSGGNDLERHARLGGVPVGPILSRFATYVVANSEFSRARLVALGVSSRRIVVVPGGAGHRPTALGLRDDFERLRESCETVVVTAARHVRFKRIDRTVAAVARLRQGGANVGLVLVGDGPERTQLETVARRRLSDGVALTGRLSHAETIAVLARCDVYISSSSALRVTGDCGSYEHVETMGRSGCEAIDLGLPVVATAVGGVPEVALPCRAVLVGETGDVEGALAEGIARAVGLPAHAQCVDAWRRQLSWEAVLAAYGSLLHGRELPRPATIKCVANESHH